jgi:hypothetical protein
MLVVVLMLSVPRISNVVLGVPLRAVVSGCLGLFGVPAPAGL